MELVLYYGDEMNLLKHAVEDYVQGDGTHPNGLWFLPYGLNLYRLLRDALK